MRLCDGIYLGDVFASKDTHFLVMNKITHIINCAGREIPNTEHSIVESSGNSKKEKQTPVPLGLKYLTFYWLDDDRQLIFDEQDRVPIEISKFVDEAINQGTSVLIHSIRG